MADTAASQSVNQSSNPSDGNVLKKPNNLNFCIIVTIGIIIIIIITVFL